jgi:hypothetical protein
MAWLQAIVAGLMAAAPGPAVVVTEHDPSLPPGCRPAEVAQMLLARHPDLTEVIVGYAHGLGQIEFRFGRNGIGKGAVDCERRRFVALGAGPADPPRLPPVCERPGHAAGAVLACVRHWR